MSALRFALWFTQMFLFVVEVWFWMLAGYMMGLHDKPQPVWMPLLLAFLFRALNEWINNET